MSLPGRAWLSNSQSLCAVAGSAAPTSMKSAVSTAGKVFITRFSPSVVNLIMREDMVLRAFGSRACNLILRT
jgi:hypothetical protein